MGARVDVPAGTVLVVSRDAEAGRPWADALSRAGLEALVAASAAEALQRVAQGGLDLIVADVAACPDGLDLCRRLRARTVNPILLLCPDADEAHSVAAYAAGADECIPKPVSPAVFLAKVWAWLRHRWTVRAESLGPLEAGNIRLDPARREVSTAEGTAIRLTALELRVLYVLMSHPGHVLASDVIAPQVWGPGGGGDQRRLRHVVHHLRQKIEPDPRRPRTIRTVRRQGYTFAVNGQGSVSLSARALAASPSVRGGPVAEGAETATQEGGLRPLETALATGL